MISVKITQDASQAHVFLVEVEGQIRNPKSLNDALGRRLARELQGHFRGRNKEPNKMQAPKTNFWQDVAEATAMTQADESGATVSIAEVRYRVHLFGGVIQPTGGRKFLTIPLIKEARAKRVGEYERSTGRKLFRLPFGRTLFERSDRGDRSFIGANRGTVRTRGGFREVRIRERSQIRPVYALKEKVTIKKDPRALPDDQKILNALQDTADGWVQRTLKRRKGGNA